jgi:alkylation response protein AidB-like acyl-CoA dehydrogenase
MDLSLTEEQLAFRALAREFLDREAVPHRAQWDRDESVDLAILPKMAELGFFGLTIPEEYGGVGGDYVTYALAMEELGRADSSLRGIVSVSNGLVGKSILGFGTEEQKQEWLPRLASAEALGCFGLTEPDVGSDAGNLAARAVRSGDDYVINGQKLFITNGTWAELALVFARTGGPGPKGISAFLVPTSTDGFEAREIKGKLGLRGQATAGFQLVQDMIADMSVDADAARLLVWRCADLVDRGLPFRVEASKAKLFASEAAVRAANLAIQVHGGAGYVDEYPAQKYLRDARVMTLYEGTSQIQKLLIGRDETGISAFT